MDGENEKPKSGKMSVMAFAGGLCLALLIDLFTFLILFIPVLGLIIGFLMGVVSFLFIVLMRLSWWIIGYDMRGGATVALINGILEMIPIWMGCTMFMVGSFLKNRLNCIEADAKSKGKISMYDRSVLRSAGERNPEYEQAIIRQAAARRAELDQQKKEAQPRPIAAIAPVPPAPKKVDSINSAQKDLPPLSAQTNKWKNAGVAPVAPKNAKQGMRMVEQLPVNQQVKTATTGDALSVKLASQVGAQVNASAMTRSAIDTEFAAAFMGKKQTPEEAEAARIKERDAYYAKENARIAAMNQRKEAAAKHKEDIANWMDEQRKKESQVNKPISAGQQAWHAEQRNTEYSRTAGMPASTAHIKRSDGVRVTSKEEQELREREQKKKMHWWER